MSGDQFGLPAEASLSTVLEALARIEVLLADILEQGAEPAMRACRVCGCTDMDACVPPCSWAGPFLCSACVSSDPAVAVPPGPCASTTQGMSGGVVHCQLRSGHAGLHEQGQPGGAPYVTWEEPPEWISYSTPDFCSGAPAPWTCASLVRGDVTQQLVVRGDVQVVVPAHHCLQCADHCLDARVLVAEMLAKQRRSAMHEGCS